MTAAFIALTAAAVAFATTAIAVSLRLVRVTGDRGDLRLRVLEAVSERDDFETALHASEGELVAARASHVAEVEVLEQRYRRIAALIDKLPVDNPVAQELAVERLAPHGILPPEDA